MSRPASFFRIKRVEITMARYEYIPSLYDIRFELPETNRQSDEFFYATINGEQLRFNIHDYDTLYAVPWLYDIALYHGLKCRTPTEMADAIDGVWTEAGVDRDRLRVLELGAGSGGFGQELRRIGARRLEALDISSLAAHAAGRDRPSLYDFYHVDDLTDLGEDVLDALQAASFNVVAMASATGWGNHIPMAGFEQAFKLLECDGWFIFHVKPNDPDPECIELCQWIERKVKDGELGHVYRESHFHRRSSNGGDIFYDVVIGRKST